MERQGFIFNPVVLLIIHQTMTTALNTTVVKTSIKDDHTSVATTSVYVAFTDPWQSDTAAEQKLFLTQGHNSSALVDSDKPTSSSLPTFLGKRTLWKSNQILTGMSGVIPARATGKDSIVKKRTWTIYLPSPEYGVALWIDTVYFYSKTGVVLEIFSLQNNSGPFRKLERKYEHPPWEILNLFLLKKYRVQIVFDNNILLGSNATEIILTYFALPLQKMPRLIHGRNVAFELYNCSGNVTILPAMKCNTVKECAHNEDEEDCDYTHQGCGPMVPVRDLCIKMDIVRRDYPHVRLEMRFFAQAEQLCSTRYGARLALLKDSDSKNFVAGIMRQVGLFKAAIGLKKVRPNSKRLEHLYRHLWQWGDRQSLIAYREHRDVRGISPYRLDCSAFSVQHLDNIIDPVRCDAAFYKVNGFVCMKARPSHSEVKVDAPKSVHLPRPTHQIKRFPTRECADGSLVQTFHLCYEEIKQHDLSRSSHNFPLYPCRYSPPVHYTVICDGNADCDDGSDEADCGDVLFPPLLDSMFKCRSFQLIPKFQQCDKRNDCFDGSDEEEFLGCKDMVVCSEKTCLPKYFIHLKADTYTMTVWPSKKNCINSCLVKMDGFGNADMHHADNRNIEGTFWCKNDDLYIPSFLLNNGEQDCLSERDEHIPLENLTCPGFYRCQHTYNCIHPDHVCDRIAHCPFKDDERYCDIVCPSDCLCEGYVFYCKQLSNISAVLLARLLDMNGSESTDLDGIHFSELLRFLNLSKCGLNFLYLRKMLQLQILDVSFNKLKSLSSVWFEGLPHLGHLNVSGNLFVNVLDTHFADFIIVSGLQGLRSLVMRKTELHSVKNTAFSSFTQLEILDIRDNIIDSFDREIFWSLNSLQQMYTDDYKLCCPQFHSSRTLDCAAPLNELSSCNNLFRLNVFRVFLWLMAVLAIFGNACVILYRLYVIRRRNFSTFSILVINLCSAGLCMGIYYMMIGIADAHFHGVYGANENSWKGSIMCKIAGFLGFVSSESSALTIFLITLDRVLVLCFPLKTRTHMTTRFSVAACGVVWSVAMTLAAVPLLADLEFYEVNGICLPLSITGRSFSGQFYSFGFFIVFNFVLFVLIGLGQILIYHANRSANSATDTNRRSQEMAIARRLFLVILSDFCCWFPVGLMGLLTFNGIRISDEVNVWAAIFVLPLNSALNPLLYTLNSCFENWIEQKLKKNTSKILGNIQTLLPNMLPSTAEEILRICIRSNLVKKESILVMLETCQNATPSSQ